MENVGVHVLMGRLRVMFLSVNSFIIVCYFNTGTTAIEASVLVVILVVKHVVDHEEIVSVQSKFR